MRQRFQGEMGPQECFKGRERFHRGRGRFGGPFDDMGNEWPGMGRGHRHGRRRLLDSGDLRLILLKLIADQPRHGYDLIQAVGDLTGGAYSPSPGVVYPALAMLEDQNLIAQSQAEGPRKAFAVTEAGQAELSAQAAAVEHLFARLGALAERSERLDAAPVRRAMENLRAVLHTALDREAVSKDKLYEIATILDSVAQQIERLP